jgi:aminoglycoside/choline kinase family phosphotransferase
MADLAALALDWYRHGATGEENATLRARFCALLETHLAALPGTDSVLIQRDYHAENLLWLPGRAGVARVGLLDFQDAMRGHRAYDLVSLLQDARRDVSPPVAEAMLRHYIAATGADADTFTTAFHWLGAQRNLRILGVFARLCLRDGKPHYIDLIPRVWAHLQTDLRHPALAPLAGIVAETLPAPTPAHLDALKAGRAA